MRPRGRRVHGEAVERPSFLLLFHSQISRGLGCGCHSEGATETPCGQSGHSTCVPQASLALLCSFSCSLQGGSTSWARQMLLLRGETGL